MNPQPAEWAPPQGWPSTTKVNYASGLIQLALLLLAVPWLLHRLLTDPFGLARGVGRNHER